ncbi:hypothetical protein LSH36_1582g00038 [Paralvinella palmiformis]|uniref:Uncharacterized protein n=1 Tax=Paralvinella palmiformis TaxID=53620 RepID=A0AAD9IRX7_9ANNE|nr:hypothetical protein LSH36_1582g00038 [Paralvinella palmiformis]
MMDTMRRMISPKQKPRRIQKKLNNVPEILQLEYSVKRFVIHL